MVKSPWGLKVNPYPHFVIEPLILMDLMGTWCKISQAWLVQVEASGVARGIEASLLHLGGRFRSLFICTRARLYSTALAQSLRSSWTSACSESCDSIKDHWEQPKWTTYPSCNQTRQWKITENHPFSKFSPLIFPAINLHLVRIYWRFSQIFHWILRFHGADPLRLPAGELLGRWPP